MRQHGKIYKFRPQTASNDEVLGSFFESVVHRFSVFFFIILEASNAFKMMFFDVLKVQGPSQIDFGSIWETSFFHHFQTCLTHIFDLNLHKLTLIIGGLSLVCLGLYRF